MLFAQGGGYVSLIDMAHALYETELRRLALLKESASLHIALIMYQMHTVNRLLQRAFSPCLEVLDCTF